MFNTIKSRRPCNAPRVHYVGQVLGGLVLAVGMSVSPVGAEQPDDSVVLFACDFEDTQWWRQWDREDRPPRAQAVDEDAERRFEPHRGKALRIRVDEDGHYGVSLTYRFEERTGAEPDAIYFRYYVRLAADWKPERGGKFPGVGGTYGRAGWGGRKSDGTDGWSARGLFMGQRDGRTPIGFYCYHADMPGKYGENWVWDQNGFEGLENNRWYCIEQYVKLNTPGERDGVLRGWVDGQLVYDKSDVRMRMVEDLKIETIWINLYYGGSWTATDDYHLYIDDVVISEQRFGCEPVDGASDGNVE